MKVHFWQVAELGHRFIGSQMAIVHFILYFMEIITRTSFFQLQNRTSQKVKVHCWQMAQLDHIFLLRTQLVQTFCFLQFFCAIFELDKQLSVYLICSSSSSALCQNLITLPCPTVRPHNQATCFFFLSQPNTTVSQQSR